MEHEPTSHEIVGSLLCEDASTFDIRLTNAVVHLFENGTHPCVAIRDDAIQNDRYFRIPNYAIPEAMAELGIQSIMHETDEDFRSDSETLCDDNGNLYQWDFCPLDADLSVGEELFKQIRPSEEHGYAAEYYEPRDELFSDMPKNLDQLELSHESTLLMEIVDWPNLSFLVIEAEEGEGFQYLPAPQQVIDLVKENGWPFQKWESKNITPDTWAIIRDLHGEWLDSEIDAGFREIL